MLADGYANLRNYDPLGRAGEALLLRGDLAAAQDAVGALAAGEAGGVEVFEQGD